MQKKNEQDTWISNYTSDNKLMSFDQEAFTYYIPRLALELDSTVYTKSFENLMIKYQFKTKYKAPGVQPLGFVYEISRDLPVKDIDFTTHIFNIIMYLVLPALFVLLLIIGIIFFFVNRSKPRNLSLEILGYLDSYEKIDYKTDGKFLTPYKNWDYAKFGDVEVLPVSGSVQSKWTSPVKIKLKVEKLPDGFELFLRKDSNGNEYSAILDMPLVIFTSGYFEFEVGIRQTDIAKVLSEPQLVKFTVVAKIDDRCFGCKAEVEAEESYKFHIGPDLQDVWVAFDPGTTGSCVAVGSESGNIRLLNENDQNTKGIVPSVITFDTNQNGQIPVYEYGVVANNLRYGNDGYTGFKSIKKMLGFKTIQEIVFSNG